MRLSAEPRWRVPPRVSKSARAASRSAPSPFVISQGGWEHGGKTKSPAAAGLSFGTGDGTRVERPVARNALLAHPPMRGFDLDQISRSPHARIAVRTYGAAAGDELRELAARVERARLHGRFVDADDLGDLLDRLAVVVGEVDHLAVLRRQPRQAVAQQLFSIFLL